MTPLRIFTTALFLLLGGIAAAQSQHAIFSGTVYGPNPNFSEGIWPIEGAVVEVVSGPDTLRTVTGSGTGAFILRKIKAGDVRIRVTHLACKPYEKEMRFEAGKRYVEKIELEQAVKQIEQVTVKAEIPLFKRSGDTLIYNAAAVKTLEGDDAIRILEYLPGIVLSNGSITAMGKEVERTYVNGRQIFGPGPMAALLNLTAADVQKIRIYDELNEEDRRYKRRGAQKRRVLDIQTQQPLLNATTGHFLASYGTDMDRSGKGGQQRYGAGLTANFFSEQLRLSANAYANNVNRASNRLDEILYLKPSPDYTENNYIGAGYFQRFGDKPYESPELEVNYAYKKDYTRSEKYTTREYFPTPEYTVRSYADSLRSRQHLESHFGHASFNWDGWDVSSGFSYSRNTFDTRQLSESTTDEERSGSTAEANSRMRNYSYSASIYKNQSLSDRWRIKLLGQFQLGRGNGTQTQRDSLSERQSHSEYYASPLDRNLSAKGSIQVNYQPQKGIITNVGLGYGIDYHYEKSHLLRYAAASGELDVPSSRAFTYDYTTHRPLIEISFSSKSEAGYLTVHLPVEISTMNRRARLPEEDRGRRRFVNLTPRLQYTREINASRIFTQYNIIATLPAMEQLSGRINDSNPLWVSAGNPSLKPTVLHEFPFQYFRTSSKGNTLTVNWMLNYRQRAIVNRTFFYKEGTTLADYGGYRIPAGGSFTTYANAGGEFWFSPNIEYAFVWKALRLRCRMALAGTYRRNSSYIGDAKNTTEQFAPGVNLGISSNFSRVFRLQVSAISRYAYTRNNIGNDVRYFTERITGRINWNITKKIFLNTTYEGRLHIPIRNRQGIRNEEHTLNAMAGYKFLKGKGAVSIACYDLLNRSSNFRMSVLADYRQYNTQPSLGRYWCVNLSYKFNKTKSGDKTGSEGMSASPSLDDGRDITTRFSSINK